MVHCVVDLEKQGLALSKIRGSKFEMENSELYSFREAVFRPNYHRMRVSFPYHITMREFPLFTFICLNRLSFRVVSQVVKYHSVLIVLSSLDQNDQPSLSKKSQFQRCSTVTHKVVVQTFNYFLFQVHQHDLVFLNFAIYYSMVVYHGDKIDCIFCFMSEQLLASCSNMSNEFSISRSIYSQ